MTGNRTPRVGLANSGTPRRLLLLTLLLLPATYPLWRAGAQATHDGLYHLSRLYELDMLLRLGVLYPRWFPHLGFLYGFPVMYYYAPLIYYIGEGFRLLGWGYLAAYEWTIGLGLVASGWTMYVFARRWGEPVGWLAALLYVYWPYHLANAHVRGAQAELWAMVWFPLLLTLVHSPGGEAEQPGQVHWEPSRSLARLQPIRCLVSLFHYLPLSALRLHFSPLLALIYALLLLTHNLSAFLFTPVLLGYALWVAVEAREAKVLTEVVASVVLGAALSALYWLPALLNVDWIRASQVRDAARAEVLAGLVPLSDLFSPYWAYRYMPFQGVRIFHPIPRVGGLIWATAIAVGLLRWQRLDRQQRWSWLFFVVLGLVGVVMMHESTRLLWGSLPFLPYLQFPWRFHALVALGAAMAVALALGPRRNSRMSRGKAVSALASAPPFAYPIYGLMVAALALSALPYIPRETSTVPGTDQPLVEEDVHLGTLAQYDFLIGLAAREWGGIWPYEYMPVWVTAGPTTFFLPPETPLPDAPPLDIQMAPGRQHPLDRTFTVYSPGPWTFTLHQFYFPAWKVTVDGQEVPTYPRGPLGLLAADIPAGEHTLRVRYGRTAAETAGLLVSLLAFLVWLAGACRRHLTLALTLVLVISLLTLITAVAGVRARPSLDHDPQNVLVGDRVRLVGSKVLTKRVRPGERVWFALDWLALAPPQERYKVIVHLEDEQGRMWANGDAEPGFFFTPTTRWEQGEVMEDWYTVVVPRDAPPGKYRLLTGMYRLETVENLPLQGGTQVGGRVLVGEIEVRP